jgi:hypothetical protein
LCAILLYVNLAGSGCAYKIGSSLVHGMLEEAAGQGQGSGVEEVGDQFLERALLVELGHQLGTGLSTGAAEITPEQREQLEQTVDSLLAVAARRTGKGLRQEVAPELRDMVNQSIVQTLADGLRGDLGDSTQETVERMIQQAGDTLRQQLQMQETRFAIADLLRDSVYFALQEGQGGTPSIGQTLEFTLEKNILDPLANTVGGIAEGVAYNVNESAQRTEQLLQAIIGALVMVLALAITAYYVRGRQTQVVMLNRDRAQARLRSLDAALSFLDEDSREAILSKLDEYNLVSSEDTPPEPPVPGEPIR